MRAFSHIFHQNSQENDPQAPKFQEIGVCDCAGVRLGGHRRSFSHFSFLRGSSYLFLFLLGPQPQNGPWALGPTVCGVCAAAIHFWCLPPLPLCLWGISELGDSPPPVDPNLDPAPNRRPTDGLDMLSPSVEAVVCLGPSWGHSSGLNTYSRVPRMGLRRDGQGPIGAGYPTGRLLCVHQTPSPTSGRRPETCFVGKPLRVPETYHVASPRSLTKKDPRPANSPHACPGRCAAGLYHTWLCHPQPVSVPPHVPTTCTTS